MVYSKDSKERVLAEGNVKAVLELRDKILGGREQSPEFYLFFSGIHTVLSGTKHQSL